MQAIRRFTTLILLTLSMLGAMSAASASANSKYAAFVIHAHSGDVLFDRYSNYRRYPASLTKMMTLYLLFDELEAGRLTLNSKLKVSKRAAGQPPSKLGVKSGSTIDVETAIKALSVKSANDVAVVVAEAISGSEWKFATKMTNKARALGMSRTTFKNASGLPNRKQVTTARDMSKLARALMSNHPDYWHFFSTKSFSWNGRTYRTHNSLVRSYKGADGLKTGYTMRSGYNLATSAKRDGNHLVGIVLGGRSSRTRDAHMRKILDNAFSAIKSKPTLISSLHRKKPAPRVKPTRLAALEAEKRALAAAAPSALQMQMAQAAGFDVAQADDDLPLPADDMIGALISATQNAEFDDEAELIRAALLGQGDTEPDLSWAVQIGAYNSKSLAQRELEGAALAGGLVDRTRAVFPGSDAKGRPLYRAQFTELSQSEAEEICAALRKQQQNCFATK